MNFIQQHFNKKFTIYSKKKIGKSLQKKIKSCSTGINSLHNH